MFSFFNIWLVAVDKWNDIYALHLLLNFFFYLIKNKKTAIQDKLKTSEAQMYCE